VELLIIRHALPRRVETTDGSPADPPLSELGRRQARALAEWLADEKIDVIHVSPMRRARQTAEPVEAALGLEATVNEGVSEYDRHSDAYIPLEELKATDYETWVEMVRSGMGLDDPVAFQQRVVETVESIVAANPGRRVAVVCHGGVISSYASHVLGKPPGDIFFFEPAYTSVNRFLAAGSGERSLVSLNERGHLRGVT
jgi:2,3-bisphosphoglycerate-dependent phosphoglycerate mutase